MWLKESIYTHSTIQKKVDQILDLKEKQINGKILDINIFHIDPQITKLKKNQFLHDIHSTDIVNSTQLMATY
jgi:hypothetical protein